MTSYNVFVCIYFENLEMLTFQDIQVKCVEKRNDEVAKCIQYVLHY